MLPGFGFESTGYPLSFFRDSLVIHDSAASMSELDAVMGFRFKKAGGGVCKPLVASSTGALLMSSANGSGMR